MDPITISVADAVHALGMGRTTIYKLLKNGSISSVRIGRRRLVLVESLQQLVR